MCRRSTKCQCGLTILPLTREECIEKAEEEGLNADQLFAAQKQISDYDSVEEYAVAVQDVSWWCSPCT